MAVAGTSESEMTVLRIKRKRTADPLDALFVHNVKKKKVEEGISAEEDDGWFRYSGTVNETQIESTEHTVRNFQTIYQQVVHQGGDKKRKAEKRCRDNNQTLSRYRIIGDKGPHVETDGKLPLLEENEINRMYRVFDVIAEDDVMQSASKDEREESILCNNVKMIREQLHVSDNVHQEEEDEYVYDLYLAPGGAVVMNDNEVINVEEYYKDDDQLTFDGVEKEDYRFDDEDDENDENNWRNEYPEDEDYYSSGNEAKAKGSDSSADEDYVYSRYRKGCARQQFDPYAENTKEEYYCTVEDDDT